MLQVTDAAIGVLRQIRDDSPEAPEGSAVRLQLTSVGEEPGLGFGFSDEPLEGDQKVVEKSELDVYLAPELVEPLAHAVVDTVPTDQGDQLVLKTQGEESAGSQNEQPKPGA